MSCELPGKCGREDIYRIYEDFFLSWPVALCLNCNTSKRERVWLSCLPQIQLHWQRDQCVPQKLSHLMFYQHVVVLFHLLCFTYQYKVTQHILLPQFFSETKCVHIRIISSPLMYNYVIVLIIVYLLHKLHRGCKYQLTSCWIHKGQCISDRSKPAHCEKKEFTELVIEWLISK